jgi:hypothetical protein
VFHMDVAKVDRDVAYVAKCSRGMLYAFDQNVSSILDVCCKCFLSVCCKCFTYVARVCLKCFSCFSFMLQTGKD